MVCLCHNLHLVAEEVRKQNPLANSFISELKKILCKNKTDMALYKEVTGLKAIPFSILTRWDTFLVCEEFIFKNYEKILEFINHLEHSEYGIFKNLVFNSQLLSSIEDVSKYFCVVLQLAS